MREVQVSFNRSGERKLRGWKTAKGPTTLPTGAGPSKAAGLVGKPWKVDLTAPTLYPHLLADTKYVNLMNQLYATQEQAKANVTFTNTASTG